MSKRIDRKLMDEYAAKLKNWGRWGDDDELGTLNFIKPEMIVEAASLVRKGKVFSLAIPFDEKGPQYGRRNRYNPQRWMLATGTDAAAGKQDHQKIWSADDAVLLATHGQTHWDSLAHVFFNDGKGNVKMWNGYPSTLVDTNGAQKCGIQNTKDKMVGRGVLLDIARFKGVDALEDGYGITIEDLNDCAKDQNVEVKQGDFVLVRTGKLGKHMKAGVWGDFVGGDAPGLEFETLEWMHEKEIAAIAADTFGVEVRPNNSDEFYQPWHQICIPILGLIHGEFFNLDELAADCAEDDRYEFLLVAPTLPLTRGVGSPVNPIAIK